MLEPVNPLAAFIKGPGLIATVNGGIVFANSVNNTIAQTTVNLTANATNFIYLQISSPVSLQVNTTGFPASNCYPIAIIVTGNNNIVTLIDSRPDAYLNDGGTISPANITVTNQLLIPVSAGFTSSVDGSIGYDSTNKSTHVRTNAADSLVAAFASAPAGGKCLQSSGITGLVSETTSACGSGSSGVSYGTDNSNTNAYVITFSPAVTLIAGQFAIMQVTNANTGAVTLNGNGTGVKNVTRKGSGSVTTALTTGDMLANFPYLIEYDGSEWQLLTASPNIISDNGTNLVKIAGSNPTVQATSDITIDAHTSGGRVHLQANGNDILVCGDGSTNNGICTPGAGTNQLQAWANKFTATAALTAGQTVKVDTANANSVVVGTTGDVGGGIIIGIVENSPGAAGVAIVVLSGQVNSPIVGTGTCSPGQFVIQDTTTNGRVQCTGTYTAGTVIGKALSTQNSVGSAVNVLVQPR